MNTNTSDAARPCSISFTPSLLTEIDAVAARLNISRSELVREAVRHYLGAAPADQRTS